MSHDRPHLAETRLAAALRRRGRADLADCALLAAATRPADLANYLGGLSPADARLVSGLLAPDVREAAARYLPETPALPGPARPAPLRAVASRLGAVLAARRRAGA